MGIGADDLDDLGQPGTVQLDQAAHQFLGGLGNLRPGLGSKLVKQRFDLFACYPRIMTRGHLPSQW
jgi:hypothetical protein